MITVLRLGATFLWLERIVPVPVSCCGGSRGATSG
jgi:hypothetical protein